MRSLPQSFHHPVYLAWTVLELISKQQSYCSTQNAAFGCNNPQAPRTAWGLSCSEAVVLSPSLDPLMQTQFSAEWNIFYIHFLKVTTAKIVQHYPFIQELCLATCRDLPPQGPHLCSKKRVDAPFSSLWKFSCKLLECYQHRQESSQSQFLCTQTKAPDTGTVHSLSPPEVSEVAAEVLKGLFKKKNPQTTSLSSVFTYLHPIL